ncbi:hypothetical protein EGW08_000631 [Elysia chlorotica]|uniref:Uncharacterized protein n=1 Tax=Elysia chlorotica TaxID=188477 RepID=A0A433UCZ8_ELYCH|nr:hypothetical protein EGW08_000631 [Elysia chlorotica]
MRYSFLAYTSNGNSDLILFWGSTKAQFKSFEFDLEKTNQYISKRRNKILQNKSKRVNHITSKSTRERHIYIYILKTVNYRCTHIYIYMPLPGSKNPLNNSL